MAKKTIARTIVAGAELRKLRVEAGLTLAKVVKYSGHSQPHLSRMETGQREISPTDAARILSGLEASNEDRERIMAMVENASDPALLHDDDNEPVPPSLVTLMCLERDATSIFELAMLTLPGLLQTVEYTRALMATANISPERIDAIVERKQARQAILFKKNAPKYTVVLDEGALRPFGGAEVMAAQLDHIRKLGEQGTISPRIIPASKPGHAGFFGSYMQLGFVSLDPIVYVEVYRASLFLDDDRAVQLYLDLSATLDSIALSSPESVNFLRDAVAKIREG